MERTDARASRDRIVQALLHLLSHWTFQEVTVTQICQEADLARKTFYRHYPDKESVMRAHLETLFGQALPLPEQSFGDSRDALTRFFRFCRSHAALMRMLRRDGVLFLLRRQIETYMATVSLMCGAPRATPAPDAPVRLDGSAGRARDGTWDPEHACAAGLAAYLPVHVSGSLCAQLELWIDRGYGESPDMMAEIAEALLFSRFPGI